jgi:hypothetical protein
MDHHQVPRDREERELLLREPGVAGIKPLWSSGKALFQGFPMICQINPYSNSPASDYYVWVWIWSNERIIVIIAIIGQMIGKKINSRALRGKK